MSDPIDEIRLRAQHMSGGPLPVEWSAGWAVIPFATEKDARAHYWIRSRVHLGEPTFVYRHLWTSLCSRTGHAVTYKARDDRTVAPLAPGSWPRCWFCQRAVSSRVRLQLGLPAGVTHYPHDPR